MRITRQEADQLVMELQAYFDLNLSREKMNHISWHLQGKDRTTWNRDKGEWVDEPKERTGLQK